MTMFVGQEGRAYVTSTDIVHDEGIWTVIRHMSDGRSWSRAAQYSIVEYSNATRTAWVGVSISHPNITMNGILSIYHNKIQYDEFIYDTSVPSYPALGKLLAHSAQFCGPANDAPPAPDLSPPPYKPPIIVDNTPPTTAIVGGTSTVNNSASDDVPVVISNNRAIANVMLGGRSLQMLVDTGATTGQVPTAFADALIADGAATEGEQETFKIADGSSRTSRTIIIANVNIGGHVVHNIQFGVVDATPLLGFNALSAVSNSFKIDHTRGVLSFS
jgi:hypothetical protein